MYVLDIAVDRKKTNTRFAISRRCWERRARVWGPGNSLTGLEEFVGRRNQILTQARTMSRLPAVWPAAFGGVSRPLSRDTTRSGREGAHIVRGPAPWNSC